MLSVVALESGVLAGDNCWGLKTEDHSTVSKEHRTQNTEHRTQNTDTGPAQEEERFQSSVGSGGSAEQLDLDRRRRIPTPTTGSLAA